jgi:hypothetical protein
MIYMQSTTGNFIKGQLDATLAELTRLVNTKKAAITFADIKSWFIDNLMPLRIELLWNVDPSQNALQQFNLGMCKHFEIQEIEHVDFLRAFNLMAVITAERKERISEWLNAFDAITHPEDEAHPGHHFLFASHTNWYHLQFLLEQLQSIPEAIYRVNILGMPATEYQDFFKQRCGIELDLVKYQAMQQDTNFTKMYIATSMCASKKANKAVFDHGLIKAELCDESMLKPANILDAKLDDTIDNTLGALQDQHVALAVSPRR